MPGAAERAVYPLEASPAPQVSDLDSQPTLEDLVDNNVSSLHQAKGPGRRNTTIRIRKLKELRQPDTTKATLAARWRCCSDTVLLECVRSVWIPSSRAYWIAASVGAITRWSGLGVVAAGVATSVIVATGRALENAWLAVSDEVQQDMRVMRSSLYGGALLTAVVAFYASTAIARCCW